METNGFQTFLSGTTRQAAGKSLRVLYTKIEDAEKKAFEEMEVAKRKLFAVIKRKKIDTDTFKRFVTHGYGNPLIKNAVDDLDAYEKKIQSKSGWQSDVLEHCLFDIAANLKALGYEKEIADFMASTDDYIEYYIRINGPSEFVVTGNESGTFIFSQTWPDRFQIEQVIKNERQLKPWGAFETLIRFKEAYDTVSKNYNLTSLFKNDPATLTEIRDSVDIVFMANDLEKLIKNEPRYRSGPGDIELDHLNKRFIKSQIQTVHNRLMQKATEQDNFNEMLKRDIDEQNHKRQSYVVQEVAPFFPIKLGIPYNPNPEPTLVRVVDGEINVHGLKEGLEKITKSNKKVGKNIFPYKIPAGTKWENVTIIFTSNNFVNIQVAGHIHPTGYADMGFVDNRTQKPNFQWGFLLVLAKNNGSILPSSPDARKNYKKQKQLLMDRLQEYFEIRSDPFETYNKRYNRDGYKIKITLVPPPIEAILTEKAQDDISGEIDIIFKELTQ